MGEIRDGSAIWLRAIMKCQGESLLRQWARPQMVVMCLTCRDTQPTFFKVTRQCYSIGNAWRLKAETRDGVMGGSINII